MVAVSRHTSGQTPGFTRDFDLVKGHSPAWREAVDMFRDAFPLLSKKTMDGHYDRLNQLVKWVTEKEIPLEEFTSRHLSAFLTVRRNKGISQRTMQLDARAAKLLTKWAASSAVGILHRDPLRDYCVEKQKRKKLPVPNQEHMAALLRAVDACWTPSTSPGARYYNQKLRTFYQRQHRAILCVLMATACRIDVEVLNLRLIDVDESRMLITVEAGKGGEGRPVYVNKSCLDAIKQWLNVRPRCESPYLFINRFGGRLDYHRFGRSFRRYREYAGLEWITLHRLRAYSLTALAKVSLLTAQKQAGHHNISTTMLYVEAEEEHHREKYQQADPLGAVLKKRTPAQPKRKSLV